MVIRRTGIYTIKSPSEKVYIGQSRNITKRLNRYKHNNCSGQAKLHAAINKHGWGIMTFKIAHELPNDVSQDVLNTYESIYIDSYKDCGVELLNLNQNGGHNGPMSNETKQKLSAANKGWNLGKKFTEETKSKMSVVMRGENNGHAKLTNEDVYKIRELVKYKKDKEISSIYNVSRGCINQIRNRTTWNNI